MIIVLIEHVIMVAKLMMSVLIKDKPDWVAKEEHEQEEQMEQLYDMLDDKADQYKAQGNQLLSDKINEMKEQMKATSVTASINGRLPQTMEEEEENDD